MMLARWLVARTLNEVDEQEALVRRNAIQAQTHRIRFNVKLRNLLRRTDALVVVFFSGCLHGYLQKPARGTYHTLSSLLMNSVVLKWFKPDKDAETPEDNQ